MSEQKRQVACSSCGLDVCLSDCHELYTGMGTCQLVCSTCQNEPFKNVISDLDHGKVYVIGTLRDINEVLGGIER